MAEKPGWFGEVVLLVEDDSDLREGLGDVIRDSGRTIFTAADGAEALRMLASDMVPLPCVILLDWVMPGVNGEEFLAELARRGLRDQVGVIVMSASPQVAVPLMPGVLGFLPKPFEISELLAALDRFC